MVEKIAILDCDSILYTAFNPNKILDSLGQPVKVNNKFVYIEKTEQECKDSCDSLMNLILTNSKASHYIGFIKGKDTIKNKLLIDPTYKQDRGKESPKYWNLCKNYLINNWGIIEANNFETDDFVNVTRLNIQDSFIVAIDGDLLGLESRDKEHYNWRKNQWIKVSGKEANYKFWSDMITGTHNNTKGIPGKGVKFVEKLFDRDLEVCPSEYTTCFEFTLRGITLDEYVKYFGEEEGINQFYKNYKMIKILDKIEGFICPKPIEYKKINVVEDNKLKSNF